MIVKQQCTPKFRTKSYARCGKCGRTCVVLRNYNLCHRCYRQMASKGQIPGIRKASW